MEWISSLKISRVWSRQDERWWTGVDGGFKRLVDRGRRVSKVGGEAWLDLGGQGISGGRKQQPAIYRKMIKIIVAGVELHSGYFHQTMFGCFPPVVIDLISTQVPAPRVLVVPNQRL